MRENAVEAHLDKRAAEHGGITIKMAPFIKGFPDRLVILPGRMFLAEVKRPKDARLAEAQKAVHTKLRALGVTVHVPYSKGDVDNLFWEKS